MSRDVRSSSSLEHELEAVPAHGGSAAVVGAAAANDSKGASSRCCPPTARELCAYVSLALFAVLVVRPEQTVRCCVYFHTHGENTAS